MKFVRTILSENFFRRFAATFAPHFVQNWLSSGIQAPQFWQYMFVPNPISANGEWHEGRLHRHDDCVPRQRYASRC